MATSDSYETELYMNKLKEQIEYLISEIKSLTPTLERIAHLLSPSTKTNFEKYSENYLSRDILHHAIRRLLSFEEWNFHYLETLSILSLTRYIFELSVWVKLIKTNREYSLVYHSNQILDMIRYYKDQIDHFKNEANLLQDFGRKEKDQMKKIVAISKEDLSDASKNLPSEIMAEIDKEAGNNFLTFFEDAVINGYEYQASLISEKMIPTAQKQIDILTRGYDEFILKISKTAKELIPKRWNWKDAAVIVGMGNEYNYIYTYTSKLLHATPVSITTKDQNLQLTEIRIFLRYVLVTIKSIVEICDSDDLQDIVKPEIV